MVTPCIERYMEADTNVVWCIAFQLAWDQLSLLDKRAGHNTEGCEMVDSLNASEPSAEDVDPESYIAVAGLVGDRAVEEIRRFHEHRAYQAREAEELWRSSAQSGLFAYACLSKSLPFEWAFERFPANLRFNGHGVVSFGVGTLLPEQEHEVRAASQVSIVDYVNRDDFLVELSVQDEEERLVLAKVRPKDTLAETVRYVERRARGAEVETLEEMQALLIPVIFPTAPEPLEPAQESRNHVTRP